MFKSDLHALTIIQLTLPLALWFFIPQAGWLDVALVLAVAWLYSCIGHHVVLHRYFTHKQFELSPLREKLLLFISLFAGLGGPVSYVATHLAHHRHSDTDLDLHGPNLGWQSFFYSFRRRPEMVRSRHVLLLHKQYGWVDQYYMLIVIAVCALVAIISPWAALTLIILPMAISNWIGAVEVLTQHWGGKGPNNFPYFLSFGAVEGLHKNHHLYANRFDCGMEKGQFDWVHLFAKAVSSNRKV